MRSKAAALAAMLAVFLAGCGSTAAEPQLETVDLCQPLVREYLDAGTPEEQAKLLKENSGINMAYQSVLLRWEADGSETYKLYFADNAQYENATVVETASAVYMPEGTLIPGCTYYWKVESGTSGSVLHEDTLLTLDGPVRFITTGEIPNVRDLGGWKTESGQQVKYGMIYRGGITNPDGGDSFPEKDVILLRDTLGIQSEIDLRTVGADDKNQTVSILGETAPYYRTPIHGYGYIVPGFHQKIPQTRAYDRHYTESIREIFRVLADESSYPVYIHCNAGADRTGTVAYLINGLLGVSYEDLTRDFELTSFSMAGRRWRSQIDESDVFDGTGVMQDDELNYVAWDKMHQLLTERYRGETLQESIEKYLLEACKVPQEDLDRLREIMLMN